MGGLIGSLAQWFVDIVYSSGYIGVGLLVAAGYLHLVVPTQLILPLAGFLVGEGRFSFPLVLAAATIGGVLGSVALYFPGLWLGEERLRQFIDKYGRYVFVYVEDLDKTSKLFDRHGGKAVLIGHLLPGITALISIPAGLKRMSLYGRFMFYTIIGSTLWNGILIGLGWVLGANYELVEQYAPIIEYGVLAAIVLAIVWFVWRRWRSHQ
jgi:membrane protein DedA with SNARE-associated domain